MKETLDELQFEYLPTPVELWMSLYDNWRLYFGVSQNSGVETYTDYVKFITQPLTLSMFVPVSEDGEVLKEPEDYGKHLAVIDEEIEIGWNKEQLALGIHKQCEQYQQAKERVIFERCEIAEKFATRSHELQSTIEYGINNGLQLKLIK